MAGEFEVTGKNASAPFSLKVHRGEGMALLAMNWKAQAGNITEPPNNFVGFALQYKEPGGSQFFTVPNRINFIGADGKVNPKRMPSLTSPIQKFRWVHFPPNADLTGEFIYRVTPVFMGAADDLSYGEPQEAAIELRRETYPGQLNVTFTRGFVASQAFVDRFESAGPISTLLPAKADDGLTFQATHPKTTEALAWMGFEARSAILEVLDLAINDATAKVSVVAYDLSEPEVVARLEKLGARLRIIIDDDGTHGDPGSGENQAEALLKISAGPPNVLRQHMGKLQHNKTIVVDGAATQKVVCGSTNYSWRGFFVQSNNAIVMTGANAVGIFRDAFNNYWANQPANFGNTQSAEWNDLGFPGIDVRVTFSPQSDANARLDAIGVDMDQNTKSSLFFSLAFLYQTNGIIQNTINKLSNDPSIFVYGISDRKVGGIDVKNPDGNPVPVFPSQLAKNVPLPFSAEPTGGGGVRMHHKFVIIDFDKPTARVYMGSYNFSKTADVKNGENLLLIRDRRIAVSYVVEAVRLFDHYSFRIAQMDAKKAQKQLVLAKPPKAAGEVAWWKKDYTVPQRIKDRELFA